MRLFEFSQTAICLLDRIIFLRRQGRSKVILNKSELSKKLWKKCQKPPLVLWLCDHFGRFPISRIRRGNQVLVDLLFGSAYCLPDDVFVHFSILNKSFFSHCCSFIGHWKSIFEMRSKTFFVWNSIFSCVWILLGSTYKLFAYL